MTVPGMNLNDLIPWLRNSIGFAVPGGVSDDLAGTIAQANSQQGIAALNAATQLSGQQQTNLLRAWELMGADSSGNPTDLSKRWNAELNAQQAVQGRRLDQELLGLLGYNPDDKTQTTLAERQRLDATQQAELERQIRLQLQREQEGWQSGETKAERDARLQLQREQQGFLTGERTGTEKFQAGETLAERNLRELMQGKQIASTEKEGDAERKLKLALQSGQLNQQESEFARSYILQQEESRRRQAEVSGYLTGADGQSTGQLTEAGRAARSQEATQRAALAAQLLSAPKDVFKAGAYFRSLGQANPGVLGMGNAGVSGFNAMGDRLAVPGTVGFDDVDAAIGQQEGSRPVTPNANDNALSPEALAAQGGTGVTGGAATAPPSASAQQAAATGTSAAPTQTAATPPAQALGPAAAAGTEPPPGAEPGGPVDDPVSAALGNLGLERTGGARRGRGRRRADTLAQDPSAALRAAMGGSNSAQQTSLARLQELMGGGQARVSQGNTKQQRTAARQALRQQQTTARQAQEQVARQQRAAAPAAAPPAALQQLLGAAPAPAAAAAAPDTVQQQQANMLRMQELLGGTPAAPQAPGAPAAPDAAQRWQAELGAQQGVQQQRMNDLQNAMGYAPPQDELGRLQQTLQGGPAVLPVNGGLNDQWRGITDPGQASPFIDMERSLRARQMPQDGFNPAMPSMPTGGFMGGQVPAPQDELGRLQQTLQGGAVPNGTIDLQRPYAPSYIPEGGQRWQAELGAQQGVQQQKRLSDLLGYAPQPGGLPVDTSQQMTDMRYRGPVDPGERAFTADQQKQLLGGQQFPNIDPVTGGSTLSGMAMARGSMPQNQPTVGADAGQTGFEMGGGGQAAGGMTADASARWQQELGAQQNQQTERPDQQTFSATEGGSGGGGGSDQNLGADSSASQPNFGSEPGGPVGDVGSVVASGLGDLGIGAGGSFQGRRPPGVGDHNGRIPYVDPAVLEEPEVKQMFREIRNMGLRDDQLNRSSTQQVRLDPSGPGGPVTTVGPHRFGQRTADERKYADQRALRGLSRLLQRGAIPGSQPGGPQAAPLMPDGGATGMPELQDAGSVGASSSFAAPAAARTAIPSVDPGTQAQALSEMRARLALGPGAMGPQTLEKMSSTQKGVMEGAIEALGLDPKDFEEAYAQTRFNNVGNVLSA